MERECLQLEQEIERHRARPGRARAMAHDVQRRIMEDDDGLPRFARASQNITAVAALLRGLPVPTTPEERKTQRDIRELLGHAAKQQVESSRSRRRGHDASQHASARRNTCDASVHQAPRGAMVVGLSPIQERVGSIRDARVILDARRREREDRQLGADHGYRPRHGGRYDADKDRSPSPLH